MLCNAYIPYGGYYCSPFSKWQGVMANDNAIVLGADTSRRWFNEKQWEASRFDYFILGITVAQPRQFYAHTWASAMMGAVGISGFTMMQGGSTATTGIFQAAMGVETGLYKNAYCLFADRCSNGPHTVWPNPYGSGGEVISENWVTDNLALDPWSGLSAVEGADQVSREIGVFQEACDELTLLRYHQYRDSLKDDRVFQKRYLFPAEIVISRKVNQLLIGDEGVVPATRDGLARQKTIIPGGIHTVGSHSHPADGNAGIVVAGREKAKELSLDPGIEIRVISYGFARVKKGYMITASAPAAQAALEKADLSVQDLTVIKAHNPFAVHDIYFSKKMNIPLDDFNNYGSSLIYGHPHAPTAARMIMEGVEETVLKGGGYFLFTGCAAGDIASALLLGVNV